MNKYHFFVLSILFLSVGCATQDKGRDITASIDDLLKLDKNYRCVLQKQDSNIVEASTVFLTNNKLLNQYQIQDSQGKTFKSQFITDNDWVYSWYDGPNPEPVKFQISKLRDKNVQTPSAVQLLTNYETRLNYTCYHWEKRAETLEIPANLIFQDVTKYLGKPTGLTTQSQKSDNPWEILNLCGQCQEILDKNLQSECIKALSCATSPK